jgi:hypothetical protein
MENTGRKIKCMIIDPTIGICANLEDTIEEEEKVHKNG